MGVGLIVGGSLLAVACGALNGSWVVPTKANAPKLLRVTDALPWEAFWLLFNVSLVVLNGIVTIGAQRGDLFRAIANTDSADVLLICFAFLGWGVGATGFGLSVKRIGVALGTALVLSAATVVGTILPIAMDFNAAKSQLWFLIAGVVVAVVGFGILGKANLMKDADLKAGSHCTPPAYAVAEAAIANEASIVHEAASVNVNPAFVTAPESPTSDTGLPHHESPAIPPLGGVDVAGAPAAHLTTVYTADIELPHIPAHNNPLFDGEGSAACLYKALGSAGYAVPSLDRNRIAPSVELNDIRIEKHACTTVATGKGGEKWSSSQEVPEVALPEPKGEFWVNISIALVAGVARALLNVGLVLGYKIEVQAQELGSSEVMSSMPVWFLGFNMCALPGIIFSAWLLTRNGTWHTLRWHPDALTARRLGVSMGSAATWVVLLHFYGVATFWLGPLGNAVAWPLLLASTILAAQVWSQGLGEWQGVSRCTTRVNAVALGVLILSVLITSAGVLVDEYN